MIAEGHGEKPLTRLDICGLRPFGEGEGCIIG